MMRLAKVNWNAIAGGLKYLCNASSLGLLNRRIGQDNSVPGDPAVTGMVGRDKEKVSSAQ
jgi:hypothetical protein